MLRSIYCLRSLLNLSYFCNDRASRIAKMYGTKASKIFAIKAFLVCHPIFANFF